MVVPSHGPVTCVTVTSLKQIAEGGKGPVAVFVEGLVSPAGVDPEGQK